MPSRKGKNLCFVCKKNPGTLNFPTHPLSRVTGVTEKDFISLCKTCSTLIDLNTDLAKALRFLEEAVKKMLSLEPNGKPPEEALFFVEELGGKINKIDFNIHGLKTFLSVAVLTELAKPIVPPDQAIMLWIKQRTDLVVFK